MRRASLGGTARGGGRESRAVRLPDGRLLGYAEYGDPDGAALISCHGGLTSRLDVRGCDKAARESGVRVISPDRPGVGLSSRQPGRSLLDWPADVAVLADTLGVGRFAVSGWSAGGPYAAACAFAMPGRVRALGLVASAVPPGASERGADAMDRLFTILSWRAPWLGRLAFRALGSSARRAPALFHRVSLLALDEPSRRLVRGLPARGYSEAIAQGLRDPAGVVEEYRVLDSPWGFEPGRITVPARIWQGSADNFVPVSWSEWLAARIPHAELTLWPGEGHFLALAHYPEIFAVLGTLS